MRTPIPFHADRKGMKKAIRDGTFSKMTRKQILEEFVKPLLKEVEWREYGHGLCIETNRAYHRLMCMVDSKTLIRTPDDTIPYSDREKELKKLYSLREQK